VEPPVGIEPTTCSLRGGRTTPTTASTSDNSCSAHTFECNSGTVRPEFAPRLIPRSASARAHVILVHEEGWAFPEDAPFRSRGSNPMVSVSGAEAFRRAPFLPSRPRSGAAMKSPSCP
jgi:hypothetical protein